MLLLCLILFERLVVYSRLNSAAEFQSQEWLNTRVLSAATECIHCACATD